MFDLLYCFIIIKELFRSNMESTIIIVLFLLITVVELISKSFGVTSSLLLVTYYYCYQNWRKAQYVQGCMAYQSGSYDIKNFLLKCNKKYIYSNVGFVNLFSFFCTNTTVTIV